MHMEHHDAMSAPFTTADLARIEEIFERARVVLEPGLSDLEIARIEERFGFRFPPDYRDLLHRWLPVSHKCIDWRRGSDEMIRERLAWPFEGIRFDIKHASFWLPEWGPRPAALDDAIAIARRAVDDAPRLIPIRGHRYIPAEPHAAGNPVFSVYQTDIIYYGANLVEYLAKDLLPNVTARRLNHPIRRIRFWSRLVEWGDE